jgi:hypothetical protein
MRFRSLVFVWVLGLTLFCAIAQPQSAQATILTVTNTADSGAGSLRDTLSAAVSGDTIQFDPSLNGETILLSSGGLRVNSGITIDGPGANLLTVRRSNDASSFAIFTGVHIVISGLTIANGERGVSVAEPVSGPGANVTIANCSIVENSIGVVCGPAASSPHNVTIINSTISGNAGGGIYNWGASCVGCIYDDPCHMTVNNTTISGNSASTGAGIYSQGFLTVTNSTITGNTAAVYGGGIVSAGATTITSSTISGNYGYRGGGIVRFDTDVSFFTGGNLLTITDSTITGNSATEGGGIYTTNEYQAGRMRNSIVALNVASSSPDIFGLMASDGFTLIGNNSGSNISPTQGSDQIGTQAAPIDPLLAPLQDNGGPTFTHALLIGSPAIDKGHSSGSTTDQRGFARPVDLPAIPNAPDGDGSDIGAFESVGAATLGNISTRVRIGPGDSSMIGGFIITGTDVKTVLVRGIGPSLSIPGKLADPIIEIHGSSGELLTTNDNWRDALSSPEIMASGLAPTNDLESALWGTINPQAYTVVVRGKTSASGIGLFEVYDLDQTVNSELGNISTRGLVGTDDDVMVGGTIIIGNRPAQILFRAIGPSLTDLGVSNALPNPMLELHDGNGTLIVSNDDWRSDHEAEIIATGIPPTNDQESAILQDLAPGNYTAIVRGVNNTSGVAVVEAYKLH